MLNEKEVIEMLLTSIETGRNTYHVAQATGRTNALANVLEHKQDYVNENKSDFHNRLESLYNG